MKKTILIVIASLVVVIASSSLLLFATGPFLYWRDLNKDGKDWFDYHERIEVLEILVHENSKDAQLHYHLSVAYEKISYYYEGEEKLSNIRKALRSLERAKSLQEEDFRGNYTLGRYYREVGDFENAIEVFTELVQLSDNRPYRWALAETYRQKGEYGKAVLNYEKSLELANVENASSIYFMLGQIHEEAGEIESAAQNYQLALEKMVPRDAYLKERQKPIYDGIPVWQEGEKEARIFRTEDWMKYYDTQRRNYEEAYERVIARTAAKENQGSQ